MFDDTGVIGVPLGGVPVTEAVLSTRPVSTSFWVVVCDPVQVVEAPGANVVVGHEMPANNGSITATDVIVTLPAFVTKNE